MTTRSSVDLAPTSYITSPVFMSKAPQTIRKIHKQQAFFWGYRFSTVESHIRDLYFSGLTQIRRQYLPYIIIFPFQIGTNCHRLGQDLRWKPKNIISFLVSLMSMHSLYILVEK